MGADWPARPRALVDRRSDADSPWEVCLADEQIRDWETVYAPCRNTAAARYIAVMRSAGEVGPGSIRCLVREALTGTEGPP